MELNIKLDNGWIEAEWKNKDDIPIETWSYSGHKEHIEQLRAKAKEFNTSLEEFEPLIKECQDSFIYPTNEEIEAEKRKQFEIQFRFDRDTLLKQADVVINKAEDLGQDTKELRLYRQELRDSTNNWVIPESIL